MKNLRVSGLLALGLDGLAMFDKLLGETMKILNLAYNKETFQFEVECIMPGHTMPTVNVFDKKFFPNHTPIKFLDEEVQVGEAVHVWIKEEEILKGEGWQETGIASLTNPESPFKIGKKKKVYLGGAHKGTVCLDEKFQPFVAIKGFRFSPKEIKLMLRLDDMFLGKNAEVENKTGKWTYNADKGILVTGRGVQLGQDDVGAIIDLLRRARLI